MRTWVRWSGMGWDGMGEDEMGWERMGWDGMGGIHEVLTCALHWLRLHDLSWRYNLWKRCAFKHNNTHQ